MSKRHTLRDRHRRRVYMEATTASRSKHSGWTIGVPKMRSETPRSILIIERIGNRRSLESFHLSLIVAGPAKILFFYRIECMQIFCFLFFFFRGTAKSGNIFVFVTEIGITELKKFFF